jgi:hypothetical protein
MCTPLETFANMILETTLRSANRLIVRPVHRGTPGEADYVTGYVLGADLGGAISPIGILWPPHEQAAALDHVANEFPDDPILGKNHNDNTKRIDATHDLTGMFPDDPALVSRRLRDGQPAPESQPAPVDAEWLNKLFGNNE